jgi:hypothetical protein
MHAIKKACSPPALVIALLLEITLAAPLSAAPLTIPIGNLAATKSGNDLILMFPTTSPDLYTVQTLSSEKGFYRFLTQRPVNLALPQSLAFAILGYSCGGIQEKTYLTGFDPATGNPTGAVYLSTSCSTGRADSPPSIHTAWAAVTWTSPVMWSPLLRSRTRSRSIQTSLPPMFTATPSTMSARERILSFPFLVRRRMWRLFNRGMTFRFPGR